MQFCSPKATKSYEIGPDLVQALKDAPDHSISYGCVEGQTVAKGTSLKSHHSNLDGVVQRLVYVEHKSKRGQGYW